MKKLSLAMLLCSFSAFAQFKVIHNVNGYTPTRDKGVVGFSTLVIKDGKVVRTGGEELAKSYPKAELIDGKGQTLLPGLIDAHGHVIGLGNNLMQLELRDSTSVDDVKQRLKAFAEGQQGWLLGRGWNQENWPEQRFPTAADLDAIVSDRPVMLSRVDGHAIWVNSKAMEMAGIDADTQAPEGGEIIRLADGKPSGIFVDNAEALIRAHIPAASKQDINRALDKAGEHLLSLGITSTHDAGIDHATWEVYKNRAEQGTLPVRIFAMLSATDPQLDDMLKAGRYKDKNDFMSIRSVKVYADGALGSRGAALLKGYADRPGHQGLMLTSKEQLEATYKQCFQHGFSANTHAIGDRANQVVLDAYEKVFKSTGGKLLRNRIEHAQIVAPEDIPRFKALDIIPSMQPVHATSDMHMAEKRLNEDQLAGAYAWQSFLKQGSVVAAGSDFPVELANPFHGLYSAITRMDHNHKPENGWRPEEALSREQALNAFTLGAAYAAFQEFKLGSLEQGKWADFIVVDKDYFRAPIGTLFDTEVMQTWIAGEKKFQKN